MPFQLLVAAKEVFARNAATIETELGGMRRAASQLVELAHELEPRSSSRNHEQALPSMAQFRVDDGVDDVHVRNAAVDDPVVSVAACGGPKVAYIAAALWLGDRKSGKFEIAWLSETFGCPLQHLF